MNCDSENKAITEKSKEEQQQACIKPQEYDHQSLMAEVDKMNEYLKEMKEEITKSTTRCHILEVDLATQFNPYMTEMLRKTKEDCSRCSQTITNQLSNTE